MTRVWSRLSGTRDVRQTLESGEHDVLNMFAEPVELMWSSRLRVGDGELISVLVG